MRCKCLTLCRTAHVGFAADQGRKIAAGPRHAAAQPGHELAEKLGAEPRSAMQSPPTQPLIPLSSPASRMSNRQRLAAKYVPQAPIADAHLDVRGSVAYIRSLRPARQLKLVRPLSACLCQQSADARAGCQRGRVCEVGGSHGGLIVVKGAGRSPRHAGTADSAPDRIDATELAYGAGGLLRHWLGDHGVHADSANRSSLSAMPGPTSQR